MNIKKLYLAHPTDDRKCVREWELEFERRTGMDETHLEETVSTKLVLAPSCQHLRTSRYSRMVKAAVLITQLRNSSRTAPHFHQVTRDRITPFNSSATVGSNQLRKVPRLSVTPRIDLSAIMITIYGATKLLVCSRH